MRVIIIIPAYNEAGHLPVLIQEIEAKEPGVDYIIVDDGSTDETRAVCEENRLNALHLPSNLGIGGAVQTGYLFALRHGFDLAVQLDGDGQHDPAYIKALVQPIVEGRADFVIGSRFIDKSGFQSSGLRRLGIRWLNAILRRFSGVAITDATSGFRACNRAVMNQFVQYYPKDYPEPESIADLIRNRKKIIEIPVVMRERQTGVSSIRLFKTIYYMMKVTMAIVVACLKKRPKKGVA